MVAFDIPVPITATWKTQISRSIVASSWLVSVLHELIDSANWAQLTGDMLSKNNFGTPNGSDFEEHKLEWKFTTPKIDDYHFRLRVIFTLVLVYETTDAVFLRYIFALYILVLTIT